jgi:hypothetical protein
MRNFIICILHHHHYGHQIKENEVERVYSIRARCWEYLSVKMLVVKPSWAGQLGRPDVDGK